MRIFARIQDGIVVELIATEQNIEAMFHPALKWADATDTPGVAPGWHHDGEKFTTPPAHNATP